MTMSANPKRKIVETVLQREFWKNLRTALEVEQATVEEYTPYVSYDEDAAIDEAVSLAIPQDEDHDTDAECMQDDGNDDDGHGPDLPLPVPLDAPCGTEPLAYLESSEDNAPMMTKRAFLFEQDECNDAPQQHQQQQQQYPYCSPMKRPSRELELPIPIPFSEAENIPPEDSNGHDKFSSSSSSSSSSNNSNNSNNTSMWPETAWCVSTWPITPATTTLTNGLRRDCSWRGDVEQPNGGCHSLFGSRAIVFESLQEILTH